LTAFPRVLPFGDRALLVEFEEVLSPEVNGRVRALARRLTGVPGVLETVPTFRSVLIVLDPTVEWEHIRETALEIARSVPPVPSVSARVLDVPVLYGGAAGPDLEAVAQAAGLTADEVAAIHCGHEYLVYMLGFAPGFPYLGTLDARIRTPRLGSPRVRVPAGSVGVADALTGIYPLQTAGGWRLIGRTPLRIYDLMDPDPFLFQPGDRVRFTRVDRAEFPDAEPTAVRPMRTGRHPIFEVLEPGLYSTIQDTGRPGFRARGLPAAGAMDLQAFRRANAAVGNDPGAAAALELTVPGPVLRALDHTTIVVAGADLSPSVDGAPVELSVPRVLHAGQTLHFGAPRRGQWAYLAVAGGIDVPRPLGSAATYVPGGIGGLSGRRLVAGDVLARHGTDAGRLASPQPPVAIPDEEVTVRYVPGPQSDWFTDEAEGAFTSSAYRVSVHSDRAGIRLEGAVLRHRDRADILSDGMLPGAIQVPGGGQPIVIMPDGPTTGGYPKIGVIISADLRLLAQARPGTKVRFAKAAISSLRGG
jgi:KipI family sensor histidine kinase inhibitor